MRKLIYEIKDLKGFVLGVGYLKDKILSEMNKNDYIEVSLLTNDINSAVYKSAVDKKTRKKRKKGKSVYIKKIKKTFRKHRPDYIICNVDDVETYLKHFVKDSTYITNQKIYIFSEEKKVDLDIVASKYKRYVNEDAITINKEYIIVDTTNYSYNPFKNAWYIVVDSFTAIYDFIGNILAS